MVGTFHAVIVCHMHTHKRLYCRLLVCAAVIASKLFFNVGRKHAARRWLSGSQLCSARVRVRCCALRLWSGSSLLLVDCMGGDIFQTYA